MSNNAEQQQPRDNVRDEKRAQFTQQERKSGNLKFLIVVLALVGLAGYLVFANMNRDEAQPTKAAQVKPATSTGAEEIRIPLKELEGGKAVFFEPQLASGKPVRFFAVKIADNTYRAALDACEVCFHAKKGYYQKGADMICRNCGRSFATDDIGPHNEGGCHPIALTRTVDGSDLVIKKSELEKGSSYF